MITKKSETEFACDECKEPIEGTKRITVGHLWKEWHHFCNAVCLHRHLVAESFKKKRVASVISECRAYTMGEDYYNPIGLKVK